MQHKHNVAKGTKYVIWIFFAPPIKTHFHFHSNTLKETKRDVSILMEHFGGNTHPNQNRSEKATVK